MNHSFTYPNQILYYINKNIRTELNAVLGQYEFLTERNTRNHIADNRERRSHARGVYPKQDISRMETTRVK